MVQIKIKGINKTYHVLASFDDTTAFFVELRERLKACQRQDNRKFEAFFHISELQDQQVIEFFHLCEECHTLVLGMNYVPFQKDMHVVEEDMRGGQSYHLKNPSILIGNIRKQAFVSCEENLYVIGKVLGSVDFLYEDCELCASYMDGNVRICDTHFQNMTSFSPCKVYYRDRHLEMKEYKEERMWERQ